MIQNDISKEYRIQDVISKGTQNSLILDNINEYIRFDGFDIPSKNILFEKYRGIILENCVKITLTEELFNVYKYRPKYLSLKLYNCTDLWHLLLWVNNMTTVTQFNKKVLYVLDPDALDIIDQIITLEEDNLNYNKYSKPEIIPTDENTTTRR